MIKVSEKSVPHSYRNKYLKNTGGKLNISGGSSSNVSNSSGPSVDILGISNVSPLTDSNVLSSLRTLFEIRRRVISSGDYETEQTEDNYFSSLRTIDEIDTAIIEALRFVSESYLSKINPDEAKELITFLKGVTIGNGTASIDAAGLGKFENITVRLKAIIKMLEATDVTVSNRTTTFNLTVQQLAEIYDLDVSHVATLFRTIVKDYISSEKFVPGFAGEGMKIYKALSGDWNLEVDNIVARKTMTIFELIISKIRAVNGGLVISPANGRIKSVSKTAGTPQYYSIGIEGDMQFVPGDLVRCQVFAASMAKSYWVEAKQVNGDSILCLVSDFKGSVPAVGDDLVQMGNTKLAARQGALYLSASEDDRPRIEVLNGINSTTLAGKTRAILGCLDGITDTDFPANMQPNGYGLYSENAWLKGVFVLRSGKTTEADAQERADNAAGGVRTELMTEINAVPGKISAAVKETKEYADKAVGAVQVGGRNLLRNSSTLQKAESSNPYTFLAVAPTIPFKSNTTYTLSVGKTEVISGTNTAKFTFLLYNTNTNKPSAGGTLKVSNEIQFVTFTTGDIPNENYQLLLYTGEQGYSQNRSLRWTNVKLELGNKPTDWTPAPEDTEAEITALTKRVNEAELKIEPDQIKATVKSQTETIANSAASTAKSEAISAAANDATNKFNSIGKIYIRGTGLNNNAPAQVIVNNTVLLDGWSRGHTLVVIRRSDLSLVERVTYDTYVGAAQCNALATKLNSLNSSVIVALVSYDACHVNATLAAAIKQCGGVGYTFNPERLPHAVLGIPALGEGKGIEIKRGPAAGDLYAEYSTIITNGVPGGVNASGALMDAVAEKYTTKTTHETAITQLSNSINLKATKTEVSALDSRLKSAEAEIKPDKIKFVVKDQTTQIANEAAANAAKRTHVSVDATGLDQNKYYPVTIQMQATVPYTITVERALYAPIGVPSWSTHGGGFSVMCKWQSNGSGWGTIPIKRVIQSFTYLWTTVIPVGSIGQMTHSSIEYIYVRGGSKYNVTVEGHTGVWVALHPNGYSKNDESIGVLDSVTAPVPDLDLRPTESQIESKFEMTTDGIKLFGKEIKLTGKVTFAALDKAAQEKINAINTAASTAQTTADNAARAASAAQGTANNAPAIAQDNVAKQLGYANYSDMTAKAAAGQTIIDGGYIRTKLINADALITNELLAEKIKATHIETGKLVVTDGAMVGDFEISTGGLNSHTAISSGVYRDVYLSSQNLLVRLVKNGGEKSARLNPIADYQFPASTFTSTIADSVSVALSVEARNSRENIAIQMVAGCVSGFAVKAQRITSSTTLYHTDCHVTCTNSNSIYLYLPSAPEVGKIISIAKRGAQITVHGNGKEIQFNKTTTTIQTHTSNILALYIFDGVYWQTGWFNL